jgi:hypothetical protein
VMIVDAREAQLHAGVCLEGKWRSGTTAAPCTAATRSTLRRGA